MDILCRRKQVPYTYKIDTDQDIVHLRAEGTITDSESVSVSRAIASDPQCHPGIRVFSDYSGVTRNDLSAVSMRLVTDILKPSSTARHGVLVRRLTDFGVVRMYQAFCDMHEKNFPCPFYSREEVLAYLNHGVSSGKVIV